MDAAYSDGAFGRTRITLGDTAQDPASDAQSDFLSDETKNGVHTLCMHEHFCEI
jgi:hypothetical protein